MSEKKTLEAEEPDGADAAVNAFLRDFVADLSVGRPRPDADHIAAFPEYADVIRRELAALRAGDAAPDEPLPRIGRYDVTCKLSEGGMGLIFAGHDPELRRDVVLKTVHPTLSDSPEAIERLRDEARALGKMRHPGICPVLDIVSSVEATWLVMPLIHGHRLDAAFRDVPAARQREWACSMVERSAHAVETAHAVGLVHRDLKPANILVSDDDEPVIIDFGLACDSAALNTPTLEGTPFYMAPEQVQGDGAIDRRVDVWALGVILFELLAGRRPHEDKTRAALFAAIRRAAPSVRRFVPDVSPDLEAVVARALAVDPAARYTSAREFADDLGRLRRDEPTLARPLSFTARAWRRIRARPPAVAAAALVLVCLGLAVSLQDRLRDARHELDDAQAFRRTWSALQRGETPDGADLDRLAAFVPDPEARARLIDDPMAPQNWAWVGGIRSGDDDAVLLWPHGAIVDRAPALRFETPEGAGIAVDAWHFVVSIDDGGGFSMTLPAVVKRGTGRIATTNVPTDRPLPTGRRLAWSVRLDASRHPDWTDLYTPPTASFTVVEASVRDAVMAERLTGNPEIDALIRASRLCARDLATDALEVLRDGAAFGGALDVGIRSRRDRLLAEALRTAGHRSEFERLRERVLSDGR